MSSVFLGEDAVAGLGRGIVSAGYVLRMCSVGTARNFRSPLSFLSLLIPCYEPESNNPLAMTPASRFWRSVIEPSGVCAASPKINNDGSPLTSCQRALTLKGRLRREPSFFRSKAWTSTQPLRARNCTCSKWSSATEITTTCGFRTSSKSCQSGTPSCSRAFCTSW